MSVRSYFDRACRMCVCALFPTHTQARTSSPSVDPDALAKVKPQLRKAIEAHYAASSSSSSSSSAAPSSTASCSRPSFVVVCPQNGAELIASRAAIEWADGDDEVPVDGSDKTTANESNGKRAPGAVVMLNPKFSLPPREMATFQCVFGLVPFKVQVKKEKKFMERAPLALCSA